MPNPGAITVQVLPGFLSEGVFCWQKYLLAENEIDLAVLGLSLCRRRHPYKEIPSICERTFEKLFFNTKTAVPNKFDGDFRIKKLRLSRAEVIRGYLVFLCGENEIRTRGTDYSVRRFSKPVVSATHPSLRSPRAHCRTRKGVQI